MNPPDVYVGQCAPRTSGSILSSQATGQDLDVHVTWDIEQANLTHEDVASIHILRGDDPNTMTPISEPLAPSTTSYLDEGALITAPGETWYQTHVTLKDGNVIKDDPVHIGGYETTLV